MYYGKNTKIVSPNMAPKEQDLMMPYPDNS